MIVLSFFSWEGVHDSSAAIVCDGRLVAAVEEERFSRIKHDGTLPISAIAYCLRAAGVTMADVDVIAFPELSFRSGTNSKLAQMDRGTVMALRSAGALRRRAVAHRAALVAAARAGLPAPKAVGLHRDVARGLAAVREQFGHLPKVRYYDHHEAHAASALFTSELDEAAIVTADGRGDPYATVSWGASGDTIRRLRAEPWTNSLGSFYRDCTAHLGFGDGGEGKTMGLASYGDAAAASSRVDRLLPEAPMHEWYRYVARPTEALVGFPPRRDEDPTQAVFSNFAAAVQAALERDLAKVVAHAKATSGQNALCLAGGVALNCAANGRLLSDDAAAPLHVFAAAGDAGLSVGAAFLAARDGGDAVVRGASTYQGPRFSSSDHVDALAAFPELTAEQPEDLVEIVAGGLVQGDVVGWFRGRSELGPRALGARSILADPRTTAMRDRVNRLKGRESWRPLAPAVPREQASEYFDLPQPSPYMLFAANVHRHARARIAATVHVDGTARPQTVDRSANPGLHALLTAFGRRTGVPVLLNTSFNRAGEPVVGSPTDAIRSFLATDLDLLVLDDLVVRRRD